MGHGKRGRREHRLIKCKDLHACTINYECGAGSMGSVVPLVNTVYPMHMVSTRFSR